MQVEAFQPSVVQVVHQPRSLSTNDFGPHCVPHALDSCADTPGAWASHKRATRATSHTRANRAAKDAVSLRATRATHLANAAGECGTPAHCGQLAASIGLYQLLAKLWAVEPVGQASQPVAPHIHRLHAWHFPDTPVCVCACVCNDAIGKYGGVWMHARHYIKHAHHHKARPCAGLATRANARTHARTHTHTHTEMHACTHMHTHEE